MTERRLPLAPVFLAFALGLLAACEAPGPGADAPTAARPGDALSACQAAVLRRSGSRGTVYRSSVGSDGGGLVRLRASGGKRFRCHVRGGHVGSLIERD